MKTKPKPQPIGFIGKQASFGISPELLQPENKKGINIVHLETEKLTTAEIMKIAHHDHPTVIVVGEPQGIEPDRTFEINGQRYEPIDDPKKPVKPGLISAIMAMENSMYPQANYGGSYYTRKLPPGINLIEEYALIQQKKSNLTRWERREVEFQFLKRYRKIPKMSV